MKALVLHDFHDLRVEDRPTPRAGPGEVLIRIIATGICGSDFHGFTGDNGRRVPGQVMGHETVGRVAGIGAYMLEDWIEGQLVTINPVIACGKCKACSEGKEQHCITKKVIGVDPSIVSAFAEFMSVPETNVVPLADDVPPECGALIEPLAVANHAVHRAQVTPRDSVLIIGGGPIGQSVVLAALRLGVSQVFVSEPDSRRRALCEKLGASTFSPTDGPISEQVNSGPGPFDVVIDAVGMSATMNDALESSVLNGRIVLVGMAGPRIDLSSYAISTSERVILGSFTYSADEFREMADWISTKPAEAALLIEKQVALTEANDAFAKLAAGTDFAGKVLVTL